MNSNHESIVPRPTQEAIREKNVSVLNEIDYTDFEAFSAITNGLSPSLTAWQKDGMMFLKTLCTESWMSSIHSNIYPNTKISEPEGLQVINNKGGLRGILDYQKLLNESGYSLSLDGIYGPETEWASFEYTNHVWSQESRIKREREEGTKHREVQEAERELEMVYGASSNITTFDIEKTEIPYHTSERELIEVVPFQDQLKISSISDQITDAVDELCALDIHSYQSLHDGEYHALRELFYRYHTEGKLKESYPDPIDFVNHFFTERNRRFGENEIVKTVNAKVQSVGYVSVDLPGGITKRVVSINPEVVSKGKKEETVKSEFFSREELLDFERISIKLAQSIV